MIFRFAVLCFLICFPAAISAADTSIVAVIYNTNYSRGYDIASYYAVKRGIPEIYLIGIPLTTNEVITKDYYYTMIRDPVKNAIISRGIKDNIRYLVTTKGMPLKISTNSDYCEGHDQSGGGAIESFLCILFDENTDYCTTPRIVNPYYDAGKPFTSFSYEFVSYCPDYTTGKVSYLVSRLDAYTPEEVIDMIDRAAAADTSRKGYYIIDDHPGAQGFEPWAMKNASLNLKELGLKDYVLYDSSTFHIMSDTLQDKNFIAYCGRGRHAFNQNSIPNTLGWTEETGYLGGNRFNWLNGAIFTTYESFNGYSFYYQDNGCPYNFPYGQKLGHRDHQNLAADFIRDGGTVGIGNVYEPFLSGVSRVEALFKYYASGYYFIDAAYMSLSFITGMNVVVGDPLCRIAGVISPPPGSTSDGNRIMLEPNFPNPFSINTIVKYSINFPARVKAAVFNSLGEEVLSVPEEFKEPDTYSISFSFVGLPSGVYFYRITADGESAAGKMIHLR